MVATLDPLPWTRLAEVPPSLAPVAPANVTFTVPFEWPPLPELSGWHSEQAMGL